MKRAGFLLAAAMLLAGCGSDSTGPSNGNNDGSAFDITIGSGTRPTYSWPGGLGFSVSVVRVSAPGTIVWGIANTAMTIQSPVTHGTVPVGSLQSANTENPLTAGVTYRVAITRADQKTGFKEFTP
jgi:hypothetical protein